jgi:aminoglycoside phosphotransferase
VSLEACLPPSLAGGTLTKIAAGMSGAGVYRVEANGRAYVLKVGDLRGLHVQQAAAAAGLAPAIVHVDEARQAIVTDFVVDRSFMMLYMSRRDDAVDLLGRTLRRVHALPCGGEAKDPRAMLAEAWALVQPIAPAFVGVAVERVLAEPVPDAPRVLCHNDINPTNVVFDGERIVLLDWAVAGPNAALYDLGAAALFWRMDETATKRLLAAYGTDGDLAYYRRFVGTLCGTVMLQLGREAASDAPALALGDFYQRLRSGAIDITAPAGKWAFGLALLGEASG